MRKLTISAAVLLAFAVLGGAAAAASSKQAGKGPVAHMLKRHAVLRESASYLGIAVKALRLQLKAGQSLAQVADATPGRSSSGLLADLVGAAKTKLDRRVAAGKLTADRESRLLDRLAKRLQKRLAHAR